MYKFYGRTSTFLYPININLFEKLSLFAFFFSNLFFLPRENIRKPCICGILQILAKIFVTLRYTPNFHKLCVPYMNHNDLVQFLPYLTPKDPTRITIKFDLHVTMNQLFRPNNHGLKCMHPSLLCQDPLYLTLRASTLTPSKSVSDTPHMRPNCGVCQTHVHHLPHYTFNTLFSASR